MLSTKTARNDPTAASPRQHVVDWRATPRLVQSSPNRIGRSRKSRDFRPFPSRQFAAPADRTNFSRQADKIEPPEPCHRLNLIRTGAVASHVTERDQTPPALVPQHEAHATDALKQRQSAHALQYGIVAQCLRKPVVGNAAAQMMDVVNADVCGEPAQNRGQIIVRTSMERRLVESPLVVARPECR